jgi:hypothetical protein
MENQRDPHCFPHREEWMLERVLAGEANPDTAEVILGVSEWELCGMLRGLVKRREEEQAWEAPDESAGKAST